MCRSIHTLFNMQPPAQAAEIDAAALQFVRKVTGFARPSAANAAAFEGAVTEVSAAIARLLDGLSTSAAPRDRAVLAARARAARARSA